MLREQIVDAARKIARTTDQATTPVQLPAFPHIVIAWDATRRTEMFAGLVRLAHAFRVSVYARGRGAESQAREVAESFLGALVSMPAWIRVRSTRAYKVPATDIFCVAMEAEAIEIADSARM